MVAKPYNGFPAAYRDKQGGAVYKAFRDGTRERPTKCIACNLTTNDNATIQAHNEDYHEPLEYVGICFYCHMAIHKRFSDLNRWRIYRNLVCRGWQPPRGRDYRRFAELWAKLPIAENMLESPPDYRNWLWLLADNEPDLYTERARERGLVP